MPWVSQAKQENHCTYIASLLYGYNNLATLIICLLATNLKSKDEWNIKEHTQKYLSR